MIPPLALFALLNVAALIVAAALVLAFGGAWWPVVAQLILLMLAMFAVLVAWAREAREFISLGVLARLPLYVIWKLPSIWASPAAARRRNGCEPAADRSAVG